MDNKDDFEIHDIFDRIMSWRVFSPLFPFYRKYKEPLLYLFFGGLCTVVNIVSFWLASFLMPPLVANVIAWILSVAFAYFTNRTWVFSSHTTTLTEMASEAGKFVTGRIGTLVMEELILYIGINLLGINSMMVKIAGQAAVVIGNYIISKRLVFKE